MKKDQWLMFLICGFVVSLNASQSLIDLFEALILLTSIYFSFTLKENVLKTFPKVLLLTSLTLFAAVGLSFLFGVNGFQDLKTSGLVEFRWILVLIFSTYLIRIINWNTQSLRFLLYGLTAVNLANFIFYFIQGDERAGGLFRNAMFYAQNLAPFTLILINIYFYFLLKQPKPQTDRKFSILLLINILLGTTLLFLSQTRGVWIGFIFAGLVNLLFLDRKLVLKLVSIGVVTLILLYSFSPTLRSRLAMNTAEQSYGKDARLALWKGHFEQFKKYPLFGAGYGLNNRIFFDDLSEDDKKIIRAEKGLDTAHAHNQYLQFLAGTGLIGLLAYTAFILSLLYGALNTVKQSEKNSFRYFISLGLFLGLICFLIAGITECNFSIAKNRSLFLFIAAATIALYVQSKKENA